MKKLLAILFLASTVFAMPDSRCEDMYRKFIQVIPNQYTVTCRATGFGEDRTDVLGFFFVFYMNNISYKAVFLYGSDFDDMLYAVPDKVAAHAKCIEGNGYRKIEKKMTSEEIAEKLLSRKDCEESFRLRHLHMH